MLEDYADLAEGLLALYAVTGDAARLHLAGDLLDVVLDPVRATATAASTTPPTTAATRGWRRCAGRRTRPTTRPRPARRRPRGRCSTYAAYTGSARHREAAEQRARRLRAAGRAATPASPAGASRSPRRSPTGRARSRSSARVDDPATARLHEAALRGTAPGAVVALGDPDDRAGGVPLLADRPLRDGRPTAYVCRHFVCDAPTTDASELAAALGATAVTDRALAWTAAETTSRSSGPPRVNNPGANDVIG